MERWKGRKKRERDWWINGGKLNYWQMLTHMKKGEFICGKCRAWNNFKNKSGVEIHFDNLSHRWKDYQRWHFLSTVMIVDICQSNKLDFWGKHLLSCVFLLFSFHFILCCSMTTILRSWYFLSFVPNCQ